MLKGMAPALVITLLAGAACGGEEDTVRDTRAMDSTMMHAPGDSMMHAPGDSMMGRDGMRGMGGVGGMGGMAGISRARQGPLQDADHEFLRMMSDHHEGLEVMAAEAMGRVADDSVRSVARNLRAKQAAQKDTMVAMIQRMYDEPFQPGIVPQNAAQADSLRQTSGAEADRYFLRTTIAHHEAGVRMIERFMSRLTRPEVRQMAERMRAEEQREIQELQGKLRSL